MSGKEAVLYLVFLKYTALLFVVLFIASGTFLLKGYYDLSYAGKCSSKDNQDKFFSSITVRASLTSYQHCSTTRDMFINVLLLVSFVLMVLFSHVLFYKFD